MQTALRGNVRIGESLGCAWFLLLAIVYGLSVNKLLHTSGGISAFAHWAAVVSRMCMAGFMVILAWLMLARPAPIARSEGLLPWLMGMAGTYGVWVLGLLPQGPLWPALSVASALMTLVGSGLIIFTVLHLGKSFSIVPQARSLVATGPYALVRHPLYAAEELALIGLAMHVVWYFSVPVVVANVALQLRRMHYEEELLTKVFPGYADYARKTARWVPGIW